MDLRPLGGTGLDVSPISLDTVKLGRTTGVKYPEPFELPSDEQARDLLDRAQELGINTIDTAPAYGTSEERLGRLLKGQRDRWVLVTKVGENHEGGVSTFDFSPDAVRASVRRSLERLGTDVLDCVLIHSDGNDLDILRSRGTLEALADLKKAGDLRAVGMSTKTVEGADLAMERSDVLMVTYNLSDTSHAPVLDRARERNVGILVKKGFMSGHLEGDGVCRSLSLILGHPAVSSLVVGMIRPDHLAENVRIAREVLAR